MQLLYLDNLVCAFKQVLLKTVGSKQYRYLQTYRKNLIDAIGVFS